MRRASVFLALACLGLVSLVGAKMLGQSIADVADQPVRELIRSLLGTTTKDDSLRQHQMRNMEEKAIKAAMAAGTRMMNENLPRLVNEELRFDKILYDGDKTLTYQYTLVRTRADELDAMQFRTIWLKHFARPGCGDESVLFLLRRGGRAFYSFRGKEGQLVNIYALTEDVCRAVTTTKP